jgi:hypothetical protein
LGFFDSGTFWAQFSANLPEQNLPEHSAHALHTLSNYADTIGKHDAVFKQCAYDI